MDKNIKAVEATTPQTALTEKCTEMQEKRILPETLHIFNLLWGGVDGYKSLWYGEKGQPPDKSIWFKTPEEGFKNLKNLNHRRYNIYHACSVFNSKSRKKDCAIAVKALWLDLDIKTLLAETKQNFTKEEALKYLKEQLNDLKGTPFYNNYWLVFSGNGFHAYWIFEYALTFDQWRQEAEAFYGLCKKCNIIADYVRTRDISSILRVPDTFNLKADPIKVAVVKTGAFIQKPAGTAILLNNLELPKTKNISASLRANQIVNKGYPLRDVCMITEKCVFIAKFKETGFANNEPAWYHALAVIRCCKDGNRYCHEFSAVDPNYNQQETEMKLNNLAKKDIKPTLCTTLEQYGLCNNCPHKKIKSPITLGYTKTAENNLKNPEFKVANDGIYYLSPPINQNTPSPLWLCSRLDVEARTRDVEGENHGKLLTFNDADNRRHRWSVSMEMLAGDGIECRRNLLNMGLQISANRKAREKLNDYLLTAQPLKTVLCVTKLGWFDHKFVFPDEVIGKQCASEEVLFQSSVINTDGFKTRGSLSDWQKSIAAFCGGNSRLTFVISTGFAASLLLITNEENGGIHMEGPSSIGKTTLLKLGCTVWGEPSRLESWRSTINGLESIATKYNDSLLCLDEIGQSNPKEIGEAIYMLSNAGGKNRSKKDGSLRKKSSWRSLFCSSGEPGVAEYVAQTGVKIRAGQQVRVLEIPADAGCGFGIFENLHNFEDGAKFAKYLDDQTKLYYGSPIREFLRRLTAKSKEDLTQYIREFMRIFIKNLAIDNAEGQVKRAASRFALIAAAGELASALDITGWQKGESTQAAKKCFYAWLSERGGVGQQEEQQIISQIMGFFQKNSQSNFAVWGDNISKISNKAGFVRKAESNDEQNGFFVETQMFKNELCFGHNRKQVIRVCIDKGWLIPDKDGNPASTHRMPDTGKIRRMYHFSDKVLGGENDE